jgi:7-cyano-7-deazaguanine reductase
MDELTHLKPGETKYTYEIDPSLLETFENRHKARDYLVTFTTEEVTSLCPITGQPDYYEVRVTYTPDARCIESKSLKLYLISFRNTGVFAEEMANRILDDLVAASSPKSMRVEVKMRPRGGIAIEVAASHGHI